MTKLKTNLIIAKHTNLVEVTIRQAEMGSVMWNAYKNEDEKIKIIADIRKMQLKHKDAVIAIISHLDATASKGIKLIKASWQDEFMWSTCQ